MQKMYVTTLEGHVFTISRDKEADNCWSCVFPSTWIQYIQDAKMYTDEYEILANSDIAYYCGSLERLMVLITSYILDSEV